MYVSRFQKWGLVKNKNESDMTFIIHKNHQRQNKNTVFIVHGREISYEKARYYFDRKKTWPDMTAPAPSTPPHILYRTPSPPPILQFSEDLFKSTSSYYDECYTSGTWIFEDGVCVHVKTGVTDVSLLDEFVACCQSATNFIKSASYIEARRM